MTKCCWFFSVHLQISTLLTVANHICLCLRSSADTRTSKNWPGPRWCWRLLPAPRPSTCSSAVPAPSPTPTMAMSSDPTPERLEPDSDQQSCSLADAMAAVAVQDSDGHGVRNGGAQVTRTHPSRPNLSGRKLSLQERGTFSSSGGGRGYMSSREARRPTVESKRVSISDSQVSRGFISISFSVFFHTEVSNEFTWLAWTKISTTNKTFWLTNIQIRVESEGLNVEPFKAVHNSHRLQSGYEFPYCCVTGGVLAGNAEKEANRQALFSLWLRLWLRFTGRMLSLYLLIRKHQLGDLASRYRKSQIKCIAISWMDNWANCL